MPDNTQDLRRLVAELAERVYRLEQRVGVESTTPAAAPQPAVTTREPEPHPVLSFGQAPVEADRESLESRIGSQWFNRIGIIAVLVGVSYFLKYAFENNWIGPAGRIAIGLLSGIGVVLWSERFRNRGHLGFSWSLKAVGVGSIYLSLWAAFQMYHLVSSPTAFAAMIVVTASTAGLAITENAPVLAAFALIGGFATPLLLSTGENHELALFSYVALLDIATAAILACRPWIHLLLGAFAGTLVLYIGWYERYYSGPQLGTTLFFATSFFIIFAVAPIFCLRPGAGAVRQVSVVLILVPLLNASTYFLQAYMMLQEVNRTALAGIAIGLAAFYLVLSRAARRRVQDEYDTRLLKLLYTGLAVGFLTTAVPLRVERYWITIAWFIESAALMWVSYRVPDSFLRVLGSVALVLGIGRLILVDSFSPAHLVFNARFSTYLIAIGTLAWSALLTGTLRAGDSHAELHRKGAGVAIILMNLLALLALNCEVRDYFFREMEAARALHPGRARAYADLRQFNLVRDFVYSAVWMAYGALLMWVGFWKRSAFLRWQALVLIAITVAKVFVYDVSELERGYRIMSFIALGVLLLAVSFLYQRDWLRLSPQHRSKEGSRGTSSPA